MIIRNLRAQMFLKTLPAWNRKVLVVNGESLGGAQSLAMAALDRDVTFACACVPALSDHNGALAGRRNGWPQLWKINAEGRPLDAHNSAISDAAQYFDTANFARRISCETSIGTGFLDAACPPEGVFAAYNALNAGIVKQIWWNPKAGHDAGNAHGGRRIAEIIGK